MRFPYLALLVLVASLLHPASSQADALPQPRGAILLTVTGSIARTNHADGARFDEEMLLRFPQHRIETTTPWTDGLKRFEGVRLRDLLEHLGAGRATTLSARALNDYQVEIPVSDAFEFDVVLALSMDGARMTRRDKGPIWVVYPRDSVVQIQNERYDNRWVWQLTRIDVR